MPLTLAPLLQDAGIDVGDALVMRHSFVPAHLDAGQLGIHANSTDAEVLAYTRDQSADPSRFPRDPPRFWVVFIREGATHARLWSVVENRGEIANDGLRRTFDLVESEHLADLRDRLLIGWKAPRSWWMRAITASAYPVESIADAEPVPFPGFGRLLLDYPQLQAVMREHRYGAWRTALSSVIGIYLITDLRDGRQYVGKADGAESIRQRWNIYATNGHGGNVELRNLDPSQFQYSLLRVFDPATPGHVVYAAESHFKMALATRTFGLNKN